MASSPNLIGPSYCTRSGSGIDRTSRQLRTRSTLPTRDFLSSSRRRSPKFPGRDPSLRGDLAIGLAVSRSGERSTFGPNGQITINTGLLSASTLSSIRRGLHAPPKAAATSSAVPKVVGGSLLALAVGTGVYAYAHKLAYQKALELLWKKTGSRAVDYAKKEFRKL